MKGTVSITIEDFQALLDVKERADNVVERTKRAAKELQVFLSYICLRDDVKAYIDEFNRQSTTAEIIIENGRALIKFKED
jgi:hypothetical protein